MAEYLQQAPAEVFAQTATLDREAELRRGHRIMEFRGANALLFTCTDPAILLDGPAGTGKSTADLALAVSRCEKIPGYRVLLLRHTRAALADSIIPTLEEEVFPPGHPCIARKIDPNSRRRYRFPNGSVIVLGGLDKPEKTYSSQYDLVIVIEATVGVTRQMYAKLLRMLRNKRMPHPDGPDPVTGRPRYLHQIICETNPAEASHWLKVMADKGEIARFKTTHKDNPAMWDADRGEWTAYGRDYLETLDRIPDPTTRARLRHGEWLSAEGAVFDAQVLIRHKEAHAIGRRKRFGRLETPGLEGTARDLVLLKRDVSAIRWKDLPEGHPDAWWTLYCELEPDDNNRLRPPQGTVYCIGGDPSWGVGAANATMAVADRNRREIVADFASGVVDPSEYARQLVMAGLWFGGLRRYAFLAWERNGPGVAVAKIVAHDLEYPWYFRHIIRGQQSETPTLRIGWVNDRQSKIDAAMRLAERYKLETLIDHSAIALEEAMAWIWYPEGGLGPASLVMESPTARHTHGDRVMARMVLVEGMDECMAMRPPAALPPRGTVARELLEEERQERARRRGLRLR